MSSADHDFRPDTPQPRDDEVPYPEADIPADPDLLPPEDADEFMAAFYRDQPDDESAPVFHSPAPYDAIATEPVDREPPPDEHDPAAPDHGAERDTLAARIEVPTRVGFLGALYYIEGWLDFPEASRYLREHADEMADQAVEDQCALAADQPIAPVPGPARAAEGLRAERDHWREAYRRLFESVAAARAALEVTEGEGEAGAAGLTEELRAWFHRELGDRCNLHDDPTVNDVCENWAEQFMRTGPLRSGSAARSGGAR